eukprot:766605-Hanusia_phi.AAC.17
MRTNEDCDGALTEYEYQSDIVQAEMMAKSSSESTAEMQARSLAKENERLKIENVQKEEDVKKMTSKLKKIEAACNHSKNDHESHSLSKDIAIYVRKDRARNADNKRHDQGEGKTCCVSLDLHDGSKMIPARDWSSLLPKGPKRLKTSLDR